MVFAIRPTATHPLRFGLTAAGKQNCVDARGNLDPDVHSESHPAVLEDVADRASAPDQR